MNNMISVCDFTNKVAIVSGASSGIGFATAKLLLEHGCFVYILSKHEARFKLALGKLKEISNQVDGFAFDITDYASQAICIENIAKKHPNVDFLVNNAGITLRQLPQELSIENWELIIRTNLSSIFNFSKQAFPLLKKSIGYSKIINVSSITSLFGVDIACAYSSSKSALNQLSKSLALAWAKDNILVNSVLPGWVNTPLTKQGRIERPEFYTRVDDKIPLKRWAESEEVAKVIALLLSDYNNYMTGSSIVMDGGISSNLL